MSASSSPITFVSSAPGKLILAGEHSVVHYTRALASVIDKRTFAEFTFTPATGSSESEDQLNVELKIETETMNEDYKWTYGQLKQLADQHFPELPSDLPSLTTFIDATLKPLLLTFSHATTANKDGTTKLNPTPAVFLLYYFTILRTTYARGSLVVTVKSQLPIGAGLGSSASFTASLSSGFVWLASQLRTGSDIQGNYLGGSCKGDATATSATPVVPTQQLEAINAWSYQGERIIHGNPSGLDNTTCVYGGVVLYRKVKPAMNGQPAEPGLMEPLTDIPSLSLLVLDTRQPRNTAELVAGVGRMRDADPPAMAKRFRRIERIVGRWLQLLQPTKSFEAVPEIEPVVAGEVDPEAAADVVVPATSKVVDAVTLETEIGELMEKNELLLERMGVGHPIISSVLEAAKSAGYKGKLTGAGGGGCMIVLKPSNSTPEQFTTFTTALKKLRDEATPIKVLETIVGQTGVWIRPQATLRDVPELTRKQ